MNHKPAQQKMGNKKVDQQNKAGSEASTSKAGVSSKKGSAPDKEKTVKRDEASAISSEATWSDPKFNDSDLTIP